MKKLLTFLTLFLMLGVNANADIKESSKEEPFILIYDNKVVNENKIGDIEIPTFIEYKKVNKIANNDLENLIQSYSSIAVIVKREFLANSINDGKKSIQSEYLTGTRTKSNPEYRQIENKISQLQNYKVDLQRRMYGLEQQSNADCTKACSTPYNSGPCWSCTAAKTGAIFSINGLNSDIGKANKEISRLNNLLASTEINLLEDIYKPYNYDLNLIKASKVSYYDFYLIKKNEAFHSKIKIEDNKIFKIPSNVSKQDKNSNIYGKYNSLDDVKFWEDQPMEKIPYINLVRESEKSKKTIELKNIYSSLNIEQSSFLAKLFAPKNKSEEEQFKRVKGTDSIDQRFYNVVIVKTFDGLGSGFFIKPNQIITNFHVIDGAKNITVTDYSGKKSSAKIIKIDARRDLALLETNLKGTPVKFFKSKINPGMRVEAIGHPRGLDYSLTSGIISGVRMYSSTYNVTGNANTKFIQTDVAINPGNSGGPLFYNQWVVGVNTQGLKKSETEGLNFSVHLDELLDFIN